MDRGLADDSLTPAATSTASEVKRLSFEDFVVARSRHLQRTAYLLTRDHHLAQDLVQTTYAKVWPHWSRITEDPDAYVRQVMRNTYTSWWRRKWRGETPTEELPEVGDTDGHVQIEDRTALMAALGRLPARQRAIVVLRYVDDLSEAETARALNCSPGNVKSQASRALARLRVDPTLLGELADDTPEVSAQEWLAGTRHKVQARRRARLAGTAGVIAIIVAAAAALVPRYIDSSAPEPVDPRPILPSVFPPQVLEGTLVASHVSKPGDTEMTWRVSVDETDVRSVTFCMVSPGVAPGQLRVVTRVDGEFYSAETCRRFSDSRSPLRRFSAAGTEWSRNPPGYRAGETHDVTMSLRAGDGDAQFGLALYSDLRGPGWTLPMVPLR